MNIRMDSVGTWDLIAYEMTPAEGGVATYPLRTDAVGRIAYGADGTLFAFQMAIEREPIAWRGGYPTALPVGINIQCRIGRLRKAVFCDRPV